MSDQLVVLFEGHAEGEGLRILARSRDPQIVREVCRLLHAELAAQKLVRRIDAASEDPSRRANGPEIENP